MSWFVQAEDNYGPEPKVPAPEEEEEDYLQLGSKPYTQLERRVVSCGGGCFSCSSSGSFFSPSLSGHPQPHTERH